MNWQRWYLVIKAVTWWWAEGDLRGTSIQGQSHAWEADQPSLNPTSLSLLLLSLILSITDSRDGAENTLLQSGPTAYHFHLPFPSVSDTSDPWFPHSPIPLHAKTLHSIQFISITTHKHFMNKNPPWREIEKDGK